jgi:hypothetical protein
VRAKYAVHRFAVTGFASFVYFVVKNLPRRKKRFAFDNPVPEICIDGLAQRDKLPFRALDNYF